MKNPYSHESLNKLEVYSIITAGTTIYCGLFYLTESLDEITNITLFGIMLISNIIFLAYWSKNMFQAMIFKFLNYRMRKNARVHKTDLN